MKNLIQILFLVIVLIIQSCGNSNNNGISTDVVKNTKSAVKLAEPGTAANIQFDEIVHDFGTMIQGERVVYSFQFVNTGGSDLIITKVSTSCGCALVEYTDKPIPAGEVGNIEVAFDSKGKKGMQNKSITVLANTEPNSITLRIKAKVILPERN